ncbi:hypothetical protein B0H13DRAFT_1859006 [Mycena leptocephala]|nr:hypothetical protein B0H13DRAFT_1859006 [Mycena leptocephala]
MIGGPKKTLLQLFRDLNECTTDQKVQDLIRHRQSARQQHVSNVETLFHQIIKVMRQHAGPYANQKCCRRWMRLPSGKRQWDGLTQGQGGGRVARAKICSAQGGKNIPMKLAQGVFTLKIFHTGSEK